MKEFEQVLTEALAAPQDKKNYSIMRQMDLNEVKELLANQKIVQALTEMLLEYGRACRKHPVWPKDDIVRSVGIMAGEAGECLRAALHHAEGRMTDGIDSLYAVECEAYQAGAMSLRLLVNLPEKVE